MSGFLGAVSLLGVFLFIVRINFIHFEDGQQIPGFILKRYFLLALDRLLLFPGDRFDHRERPGNPSCQMHPVEDRIEISGIHKTLKRAQGARGDHFEVRLLKGPERHLFKTPRPFLGFLSFLSLKFPVD